jgi:hypothetical protein
VKERLPTQALTTGIPDVCSSMNGRSDHPVAGVASGGATEAGAKALTVMANEKPHIEDFGPSVGPSSVRPTTFFYYATGLASDVNKIITDLLERGNPTAEA